MLSVEVGSSTQLHFPRARGLYERQTKQTCSIPSSFPFSLAGLHALCCVFQNWRVTYNSDGASSCTPLAVRKLRKAKLAHQKVSLREVGLTAWRRWGEQLAGLNGLKHQFWL